MSALPPDPERPVPPAGHPSDRRWVAVGVVGLLGAGKGLAHSDANVGSVLTGGVGALVLLAIVALVVWLVRRRREPFRDSYLSWWTLGIGGFLVLMSLLSALIEDTPDGS